MEETRQCGSEAPWRAPYPIFTWPAAHKRESKQSRADIPGHTCAYHGQEGGSGLGKKESSRLLQLC